MIQTYTRLNVADNSGAKRIRLINIRGPADVGTPRLVTL